MNVQSTHIHVRRYSEYRIRLYIRTHGEVERMTPEIVQRVVDGTTIDCWLDNRACNRMRIQTVDV